MNVLLVVLAMLAFATEIPAKTKTFGMVADDTTGAVTVFDADTDKVLGTVFIGISGSIGDVSIVSDQTKGFVTDFTGHIWIIDLTTPTPTLASGTNPVNISNNGEDTSVSPDGKYLLTCDGSALQPISVIDILTRTQLSTFNLGSDCNSIDICSNGSVLVTSSITGNVRRLILDDDTGTLTDTGEVLFSGGSDNTNGPNNVFCAPGDHSGAVVRREPREVRSFTIPGLAPVDTRPLTGTTFSGISGIIKAQGERDGDRVFVRSNGGAVDVFRYDAATAALSTAPLFSINIASTPTFYGMDQMALTPNGNKLYVSQPNALKVYNAYTGEFLRSITSPDIIAPTGVAFARGFLAFPLHTNNNANGTPKNPDKVQINSVFDHNVPVVNGAPAFYKNDTDGVVKAYTGETGSKLDCQTAGLKNCSRTLPGGVVGYKNAAGSQFFVNGTYNDVYLDYEGHPGFDYHADMYTPIFASADGIAFIPDDDPITSSKTPKVAVNKFNILAIDHGNGYSTWYLHLGDDAITGDAGDFRLIKCPGDPEFLLKNTTLTIQHQFPVDTRCQIALVGDKGIGGHPHLHFEVRIGLTKDNNGKYQCVPGTCMPVDPYGWTDPDPSHRDPYVVPNVRLWR